MSSLRSICVGLFNADHDRAVSIAFMSKRACQAAAESTGKTKDYFFHRMKDGQVKRGFSSSPGRGTKAHVKQMLETHRTSYGERNRDDVDAPQGCKIR
jgi:hypothetical protein